MATQYGISIGDGTVYHINTTNWATSRDATAGSAMASITSSGEAYAIRERAQSGRGGSVQYQVWRSFLAFDTSGISSAPSEGTLKDYGLTNTGADFFVVKSTHTTTGGGLALADFDAITGWSAGADNEGNVTKYSSEITSWSTSGYNDITLNSTALSDMSSLDTFKVCLIGSVYDLRNVAPTPNYDGITGMYYTDNTGTSKDPYIDYEAAVVSVTYDANFFGANF